MNIALRKPMALQEFLAWEAAQPAKWEFNGFEPVAMVGVRLAHSAIQVNLLTALRSRLRGKPCRPHGSDLKIEVAGRIRYPDAFVVCTPVPPRATVVTEPVVVFEILGGSTAGRDLIVKNAEYRATPSVQRYVILEQTDAGALVFARKGEDWVSEVVAGDKATLYMPEIGIEIPLTELYANVELTGRDDDEA